MGSQDNSPLAKGMVTLYVPFHYSYARIIRQAVVDICLHAGLSEFKTAQLEMAVDEAASIIFSSQIHTPSPEGDKSSRELSIKLLQEDEQIVVELCHGGPPIEMGKEANPETWLGDEDPAAAGLFVIRRFVDDMAYNLGTASGNCLRLIKKK